MTTDMNSRTIRHAAGLFACILLTSVLTATVHAESSPAAPEFPVPEKVTLVNFYAKYCFACRMLKPVLERITEDENYQEGLVILNVNAENNRELAKEMKVFAVPVLFFYDPDGHLHLRHEGYMNEENIRSVLGEMGLQ